MTRAPIPLLLTRPGAQNDRLWAALSADCRAQLTPVATPLMQIVPLDPPAGLGDVGDVIFTSAAAVDLAPQGAGRRAFCVGMATTQAAREAGWQAQMAGATAETLIARLIAAQPQTLTHFRGTHSRGDVARRLTAAGHVLREMVLYDQRLLPLSTAARAALDGPIPAIVPLFSPRMAAHFAAQTPAGSGQIAALSPAVAQALGPLNRGVMVAATPDLPAMALLIEKIMRRSVAG